MKIKIFIALFVCLVIFILPGVVKAVTSVNLFQITTEGSQQGNPIVYKDTIAYDSLSDIWGYNFQTKLNFPILQKPGLQFLTSFYNNLIVYDDFNDTTQHDSVHLYNIKAKKDTLVAGEPGSHNDGVTNGEYVVFIAGGACGSLNAYNIRTKVTTQIYSSTCTQIHISRDIIVFPVAAPGGTDVKGYNLETKKVFDIATGDGFQEVPNIYNDKVVWLQRNSGTWGDDESIVMKDLHTGVVKTLYETTTDVLNWPAISDSYVVWSQASAPNIGGVMGENLRTKEVFTVYPQGSQQNTTFSPVIWGNTAAWMSWRTGNGDIYGAEFSR